jgi:flavin-dependent dehydrogenase
MSTRSGAPAGSTSSVRAASFDAVVAGGGPAGAAAAITLARCGRRVLLLEARSAAAQTTAFKIGEALPPAARPLLRDLRILDELGSDGHLPSYGTVAAWGDDEPAGMDFVFDPNGHGWHLDRVRFEARLRDAAGGAGAVIREATKVEQASRAHDGRWTLGLSDRRGRVTTRALVDATGRPAVLARQRGARRHRDDRLVCVFAVFAASPRDEDTRTLVEAVRDGWWYAALVPGGRRVVAFMTDADLADRALRTRAGFTAAVGATAHVARTLWKGTSEPAELAARMDFGPRTAAAHSSLLESPAGRGWVAVGDAALAYDPLSSQGILTALVTGQEGGRALHGFLAGEKDAIPAYVARVAAIAGAYRVNRERFYALERRWPDAEFWRRRVPPASQASRREHEGRLARDHDQDALHAR